MKLFGPYSEETVTAAAKAAYQNGAADIPLRPATAALLVIDMQEEFVRPGWSPAWIPDATRMAGRLAELVADCRQLGVPIIYTVFDDTHHRLDRPRTLTAMPHNPKPVSGDFDPAAVWPELAPERDDVVIRKPSYGAFYDTPLDTILRNLRRDTVIITGTLTNYCCGTTARQAYERGYGVIFSSDCTATDDPERHEQELAVLRKGFARVLGTDAIRSELVGLPA